MPIRRRLSGKKPGPLPGKDSVKYSRMFPHLFRGYPFFSSPILCRRGFVSINLLSSYRHRTESPRLPIRTPVFCGVILCRRDFVSIRLDSAYRHRTESPGLSGSVTYHSVRLSSVSQFPKFVKLGVKSLCRDMCNPGGRHKNTDELERWSPIHFRNPFVRM